MSTPERLHAAQAALLRLLDAVGLADQVDGQPAWPWAYRLAVETLALDAGLTRQLLWAAASAGVSLILLVLAWRSRRVRWPLLAVLPVLWFVTPWPSPPLLVATAVPTSFHQAPLTVPVARLSEGMRLYTANCAACHGADGRGETARAAELSVWPPRLSGALLWKRAEGETFWHVREGMRDRQGRATMPAFGDQLSSDQIWSVLAALRIIASGQGLKQEGRWAYPVAAPDLRVRCGSAAPRLLSTWRGTRVRLALAQGADDWPREDPRFETVVLTERAVQASGCVVVDEDAPQARRLVSQLAGLSSAPGAIGDLAGLQLLVDRDGWLRALGRPAAAGWRAEDLVCRSSAPPGAGRDEDALDSLIRRMDADPVRPGRALRHGGGGGGA